MNPGVFAPVGLSPTRLHPGATQGLTTILFSCSVAFREVQWGGVHGTQAVTTPFLVPCSGAFLIQQEFGDMKTVAPQSPVHLEQHSFFEAAPTFVPKPEL